jgi:hypothetical protein
MAKFLVAIDGNSFREKEALLEFVGKTKDHVDGYQVNPSLIFSGLSQDFESAIEGCQLDVLMDLRLAEVGLPQLSYRPLTDEKFGPTFHILGALSRCMKSITHVTMHAFPGPVSVREGLIACEALKIKVLLITYMDHLGGNAYAGSDYARAVLQDFRSLKYWGLIGPFENVFVLDLFRTYSNHPVWSYWNGVFPTKREDLRSLFKRWFISSGRLAENALIVSSKMFSSSKFEEELLTIKSFLSPQ